MNFIRVLIAAILGNGIGFLWYSPYLFGKLWMRLVGLDNKKRAQEMKKGMMSTMLISFAGTFVTSTVLAYLFDKTVNLNAALFFTTVFWLGFTAPVLLGPVLWEKKPWTLFLINAGHYLVSMIVIATVLSLRIF